MLKLKRENFMLNNIITSLSSMETKHHRRTLFVVLLTLILSACSVTPDSEYGDNSNLSSDDAKIYAEAVAAMKSGDSEHAQTLLSKVIKLQPNFSNAHVNLSIVYIKNNLYKEAETSLQQALKINPDNIYALNQQGFINRVNGDFSKAKESYEKALNIKSDYAYAHLNLGILYDLYLYDLDKAISQYKTYKELSKGDTKQVDKWIFELEKRQKTALGQK